MKLKHLIKNILIISTFFICYVVEALPQCAALFPGNLATFNNSQIKFDDGADLNYPSAGRLITSVVSKTSQRPKCPSPYNCYASGTNAISSSEAAGIPSNFKTVTGTTIPAVLNGEYYFDQQILDFSSTTSYQVTGPTRIFLRWSFNSSTKAQLRVLTSNISYSAGAYLVVYVDGTVLTGTSTYFKGFIYATEEVQLGSVSTIDGGVTAGGNITVGDGFVANQLAVPSSAPGVCGSGHGGGIANAHYPLDFCFDVISSNVYDLINNYLGIAHNTAENSNGKINYSADFSANSISDYLEFTDFSMWQGKSSFALSMWLDFDPARALQTVFSATSSSGAAEFTVELRKWNNNNLFYPQISFKGYQFWFNYPISSSGWQHLTVSVEQRNVCVYINGGSSECVDFGSGTGTLSLNKMVLGQKIQGSGFTANQDYLGLVDEVVFFDSSLSLAEANTVYNNQNSGKSYNGGPAHTAPDCLIGWYRFENNLDDSSTELVNNLTGTGNVAFNYFNPDPAYGVTPNSTCRYLDLDGQSYAKVNDTGDYNQEKITVSAWIYPTRTQTELQAIVSKDEHFEFHLNNQRRLYWWWTNSSRNPETLTSNQQIPLNQWTHVAVTYKAGAQRMYINGVLDNSSSFNNGLFDTPCDFYIGIDTATSSANTCGGVINGRRFTGKIDEVKIYASALDLAEVQADMTRVHYCTLPPPIDHYRLELADNLGLTCQAESMQIKACADASCSSFYSQGVTGTLNVTPNTAATWSPSNNLNFTGSQSLSLNYIQPDTVQYSLSNASPNVPLRCFIGGSEVALSACKTTFKDSGFVFTDALGNAIANQVAAVPFTSYLKAVEKNTTTGACQTALTGPQTVELKYTCQTPNACSSDAAMQFSVNSQPILSNSFSNVSLNFDPSNNNLAALNNIYPDAGLINLQAQKSVTNGALLQGASDPFTVRPDRFEIILDEDNHSPTDPSYAVDENGSVFKKTKQGFPITINAVNRSGLITTNFRSSDLAANTLLFTHQLQAPSAAQGGVSGQFSPAASALVFNQGQSQFNGSWDEVGIIGLSIEAPAGSYQGHQESFSGSLNNIGRFVPAAFLLKESNVASACSASFSYLEQPFNSSFVLHAVNDATDINAVTQNYFAGFAKAQIETQIENNQVGLNAAGVPNYQAHSTFKNAANQHRLVDKAMMGTWVNGIYDFSRDDFMLKRNDAPDGPFTDVDFVLSAVDGITALANLNENPEQNNLTEPCGPAASSICTGVRLNLDAKVFRYGRYELEDTYGSAFNSIQVPLKAQYWAQTQWLLSADDSCSQYQQSLTQITPLSPTLSFSMQGSGAAPYSLVSGKYNYELGQGLVVEPLSQEQTGMFNIEYSATPTWLQFDWLGDGSQLNPRANIQFGRFRGNDRVIYWRESN
ncbi:Mannose-sensitive agglutinin (MSHA) biogenesis protein MshQ (pilus type IV) [Pseudoalteromonas tunicata]|uniref:Putative Mannose-sensitive agglutinin (MSHA) biogenesis protein MshQ (Pilus type IV) n=1 Tax=Pseudoalteromonas tunicata D2 TaxID=87626 RepID=A4C7Z9_9GAMM|nr:Mannose-sensitive agglutinin (MSHA) biogenesis protein MshQ (pilus type IV) [Pseudoalteromonas tunicata]ATC93221.1 MSHA biogenesis protein MshQ [Pseudoalteromonas tunicata]EAR28714.1 putative Mannose-sensitive agglutinin (MSHA) biogenesis protein MshQ (pilus type IV) [Pseudoalteromonas tunicata D2]